MDPHTVVCPFEPFPQSMDVRYYYGDVLVIAVDCSTCVVVAAGLVVSRGLSIMDIVFAVEFVIYTVQCLWWKTAGL